MLRGQSKILADVASKGALFLLSACPPGALGRLLHTAPSGAGFRLGRVAGRSQSVLKTSHEVALGEEAPAQGHRGPLPSPFQVVCDLGGLGQGGALAFQRPVEGPSAHLRHTQPGLEGPRD